MKKIRILAMILAAMMCLSIGVACAEEDDGFYTPFLIGDLDVTVEEWLLSPELRAVFAVLMHFELYEIPEFNMDYMMSNYSTPTIYVTVPSEVSRQGVGVLIFYTDAETVYSASYYPVLGEFTAFQTELSLDPAVTMESLDAEGLFEEYHLVTTAEYFAAGEAIDACISGD